MYFMKFHTVQSAEIFVIKFKKSLIPEIIFEIYINSFYKDEKNNNTADKKRKRRRISASKIPGQILIIDNIVNYANVFP